MIVQELKKGIWQIATRETEMPGSRNRSYSDGRLLFGAYLMNVGDAYVLLGAVPERHTDALMDEVKQLADEKPVRWAVLFGTTDDVACTKAAMEHFPGVNLIAGHTTLFTLDSLDIRPVHTIEIRADRTLTLGGRTFDFHMSADRFGTPFLTVTDREAQLSFGADALPPAPKETQENDNRPTVAVIHTGGSIIGLLAKAVESGIASYGDGAPKVLDLDLSAMDQGDVLAALHKADTYIFGSEGRDGNVAKAVWDIVTSLRRKDASGKRAAVFYTQNAGEPVPDMLRSYLAALGMKLDLPDWFVLGVPTEKDLKRAFDYGFGIACCVLGVPNPRQPKLVKCLVCGEIFDASLGACPVCGVGLDQCVPVDEEEITYRNDTDRKYLIIGGCSAGVAAAEAIRQRDTTGKITILSAENHLPINRPMITKGVIDEVVAAPETIYIHPIEWYNERNIDLCLGTTATVIHPESKTVETADGPIYEYDKLILAVGAECFMPPFQGHELDGVLTVRHLSDAADMVARMKTCRSAVVIGGGVLGLEAAGELMRSAIPVTVLEATPQIMWKQIDSGSAARLREIMKSAHIDCYEGISVEAIEGDEAGHVTGVRLGDGRFFPADMVIVSCGMKANTKLAADAGIAADCAIIVDMFMRTNAPDIYACGDCCAYDGVNYQLMQEANAQGRVAGAHATGDTGVYYANRVLGMHVEGVGATMYAIGDAGKKAELSYKTVETNDAVANRKETWWFARGVLQGAVVINADEKIQLLTQSLEMKARHSDLF